MFFKLFLLFLLVPFIEVVILIKMAATIGFWPTLAIQVVTGLVGATLAKIQGWITWIRIQKELLSGHLPANELIDGLLILIAGVVLLTPGLLTDSLGILILFPPTRAFFRRWILNRLRKAVSRPRVRIIDVV